MVRILRSGLFKRQVLELATNYRHRAGAAVASRFVSQIEDAVRFIAARPLSCSVYIRLEGKEFRKWSLDDFPVSIFFRMSGGEIITLEVLYAQRMNISTRLSKDAE